MRIYFKNIESDEDNTDSNTFSEYTVGNDEIKVPGEYTVTNPIEKVLNFKINN